MSQGISWNPPSRRMIANLADTQYDVVVEVCEDILGWKIVFDKDVKEWDLYWTDSSISTQMLSKMKSHQKINHFPGMSALSRKNTLAKNIRKMQEGYETQYSFFPQTWLLPQDINSFKRCLSESRNSNKIKYFIVKPEASSQGRGIYLTHSFNEFKFSEPCVVQQYVSKPLLFNSLKFDLRIYVLVAGCDPLRMFIYNEGLVRFSTEGNFLTTQTEYEHPSDENLSNLFMHLTNYSINKKHPGFIQNQSEDNMNVGHKRSLSEFFKTLRHQGVNSAYIWSQIKDITVKTLISAQPYLAHQYKISQPNNVLNNMCFEVLGFDFLIQKDEKVFLLQINHSPSFKCDSPLDHLLKTNLIADTVELMNITTQSRNDLLYQSFIERDIRIKTGKRICLTKTDRERLINDAQYFRNEYQDQHCGSYERIYPSLDYELQSKYQMLIEYATSRYINPNSEAMVPRRRFTRHYVSLPKKKTIVTEEQQQQSPVKSKYGYYDVSLPRLVQPFNDSPPSASKRIRAVSKVSKGNQINPTQFSRGQNKKLNQNFLVDYETTMFSRHHR